MFNLSGEDKALSVTREQLGVTAADFERWPEMSMPTSRIASTASGHTFEGFTPAR